MAEAQTNTASTTLSGVEPGEPAAPPLKRRAHFRRHSRRLAVAAIALIVIASASVWYWRSLSWESTDNAQIDGFIYPISARVSGHVTGVMVDDNQYVEAGTVLAQLDPKDYQVALSMARAALGND
jgi:membrane fusion protein (multidrug efflux system)